jgi:hypothetical protein
MSWSFTAKVEASVANGTGFASADIDWAIVLRETPDPGVQCTGVRPARIEAGDRGQKVVIEGAGFARPHSFDRIWVGDRWVRTFEILGDNEVSFMLPKDIAKRTGSHPVVFVTDRGSILCPESIEIFEVAR